MVGRERVVHLLKQLQHAACRCPAHSNTFHQGAGGSVCTVRKTDYAFEMASSNIRYGGGVSREIGMVTITPSLDARMLEVLVRGSGEGFW
eukprot:XP_011619664.1 PREDICTED: hydroxyacid-oxoacid transhydrogenase, mitochondrial-like [Takifugu rubripes]